MNNLPEGIEYEIEEMAIHHYDDAIRLWGESDGIGISGADSRESISSFLEMNRGLCFVAVKGNRVIGTSLCGSDGRRGYLHHLAVEKEYRFRGIGKALAKKSLGALSSMGIDKCHIHVFEKNKDGILFWQKTGWLERSDLVVLSYIVKNDNTEK